MILLLNTYVSLWGYDHFQFCVSSVLLEEEKRWIMVFLITVDLVIFACLNFREFSRFLIFL